MARRANAFNTKLLTYCTNYPLAITDGNLGVAYLGGGPPSAGYYWRGDGTWALATLSPGNVLLNATTGGNLNALGIGSSGTPNTMDPMSSTRGGIVYATTGSVSTINYNDGTLVGNASAATPGNSINANTGMSVTKGQNTMSFSFTGLPFVSVASTGTFSVNRTYLTANGSANVVYTLPASSNVGDYVIVGSSAGGGYKIAQQAGQYIRVGYLGQTTTGTSGYINTTVGQNGESMLIVCIAANTGWAVVGYPQTAGLTIV